MARLPIRTAVIDWLTFLNTYGSATFAGFDAEDRLFAQVKFLRS